MPSSLRMIVVQGNYRSQRVCGDLAHAGSGCRKEPKGETIHRSAGDQKKTCQPELRDYSETSPRRGPLSEHMPRRNRAVLRRYGLPHHPARRRSAGSLLFRSGSQHVFSALARKLAGCASQPPALVPHEQPRTSDRRAGTGGLAGRSVCGAFTDVTHNTTTRARGGRAILREGCRAKKRAVQADPFCSENSLKTRQPELRDY
jgi:hypothetical protein